MDAVISVDTAVLHVAGGLGVPVYILLVKGADWRWMRGRADTPWYPAARLFRITSYNVCYTKLLRRDRRGH